jgi:predicted metal-binding membrane protein
VEADRLQGTAIDRRQLALIAALLAIAALAWLLTARRMAGMDAGPGTDPGSLAFYLSTWVVMMSAMMFPSAAPAVAIYGSLQRRRPAGRGGWLSGSSAFVAGYLVAWTAFGLVAYACYELLRSARIEALAWDRNGPYAAGAVIALAAVYQLTPLKGACLARCRNPVGFLLGSWREGRLGALRLGAEHGAFCVGCCWALMAALFAVGVMSVAWMALVAALVAAEKLLPWRRAAGYGVALLLVALALGVALAPGSVPGLTLPGSAEVGAAMDGMSAQGMR